MTLLLIWAGVALLLIWPVTAHLAGSLPADEPIDWVVCGLMGLLTGVAWPAALPIIASWFLWERVLRPSSDAEKVEDRP